MRALLCMCENVRMSRDGSDVLFVSSSFFSLIQLTVKIPWLNYSDANVFMDKENIWGNRRLFLCFFHFSIRIFIRHNSNEHLKNNKAINGL